VTRLSRFKSKFVAYIVLTFIIINCLSNAKFVKVGKQGKKTETLTLIKKKNNKKTFATLQLLGFFSNDVILDRFFSL